MFGIILSRMSLGARATQIKLTIAGLVACALAQGSSRVFTDLLTPIDLEFALLFTTAPVPPLPLYMFARLGAACFMIGICLLGAERLNPWGVVRLVVPAGRQTLTLYVAHILIGMGTLEALGRVGGQTIEHALIAALLFSIGATLYALLWSRWFKRGPIEAAMRKIVG